MGASRSLADDAYRSIKSGTLQTLESSDTIADGLRASLAVRTFAILRKQLAGILLVSEKEIVETMQLVAQRMKLVVEPSSAVALAPLLKAGGIPGLNQRMRKGKPVPRIGIIFSGGNV